jgi:hypothetical protein
MPDAAGKHRRVATYFLRFRVIRKCRSRIIAAASMLPTMHVQEVRLRQYFLATATLKNRTQKNPIQ